MLDDIDLSYNVITNKTLISNSELDKLSDFNIELEGNYEVSTLSNIDQTNLEIKLNNLNSNNNVLSDITIGVTKPQDVNNSSIILLEGLSKGSQVGITADAQDADSDVSYSLTDSSGGSFKIDSTTGVVTTDAVLDYETSPSHTITVEALRRMVVRTHLILQSMLRRERTDNGVSDANVSSDTVPENSSENTCCVTGCNR